ncbi:hypothetical protein E2R60_04195 [Paenibacillus dendritiformis]|uniref:hypothetical protein n=1 Tax=Paenibacillus dendritiformis TaxID=130049 RepID=UPI0010598AA8|nr:hypothetical protein [Paenibacillus dendritiformis]TDL57700.1 hypothetical protein E2R60_04195 [Paenibacillus dendritiformis]
MNLALYISYKKNIKDLAELIGSAFNIFTNEVRINAKDDYYYITNPNFSLHIDNDESSVDYIKEELNLDINRCVDITVFSQAPEVGIKILFQSINSLMSRLQGDVAFTDSASGVIFVRSGGKIIINSHCKENPDIYDWPYQLLDGPYQEKNMEGLV